MEWRGVNGATIESFTKNQHQLPLETSWGLPNSFRNEALCLSKVTATLFGLFSIFPARAVTLKLSIQLPSSSSSSVGIGEDLSCSRISELEHDSVLDGGSDAAKFAGATLHLKLLSRPSDYVAVFARDAASSQMDLGEAGDGGLEKQGAAPGSKRKRGTMDLPVASEVSTATRQSSRNRKQTKKSADFDYDCEDSGEDT